MKLAQSGNLAFTYTLKLSLCAAGCHIFAGTVPLARAWNADEGIATSVLRRFAAAAM